MADSQAQLGEAFCSLRARRIWRSSHSHSRSAGHGALLEPSGAVFVRISVLSTF